MEITGIISALLIGLVVGGLGRLVVPGRAHISMLLTIFVGVVAAFLGTAAATVLGVADTPASTGSNSPSRSAWPAPA